MKIHEMKLHDILRINDNAIVFRVSGGWIYRINETSTFVPFSSEFDTIK